ncbi:hypothetical protein GCM10022402_36400 [Salinactinospora qingdaonensis]|uniref:DUF2637 domain-containing protein n=1 Tax=Salinactinospora qingdaonensis TaxID=702744 RepID=A0ABP7G8G1_9ACTN
MPWWGIAAAALVVVALAIWGLRTSVRRGPLQRKLHAGYGIATIVIALAALALITVAFTMSYAALYASATWLADTELTVINGGDLRFLFPVGIDAVIVYFLAMDLLMEWQGRRHPLNRWAAYGLSAITIILNVSQGEETTASYLGHAGPPVVIILIAEGVAAWVRHLAGLAHGYSPDRIPAGRWIAHPFSTLKVARLMLGWGITSYPEALVREQRRQLAYAMLREQYGSRWRRATPRHLKWMLDNGYDLDTAFALTRAMTAERVAMTAAEAGTSTGQSSAALSDTADSAAAAVAPAPTEPVPSAPQPEAAPRDHAEPLHRRATANGHAEPVTLPPASEAPAADDTVTSAAEPHQPLTPSSPAEEPSAPAEPDPSPAEPPQRRSTGRSRQMSPEEKRQRVRQLLVGVPDITDEEIAAEIGVAPRTARRYRSDIRNGISAAATETTAPEGTARRR